jgi:hypothetical protein
MAQTKFFVHFIERTTHQHGAIKVSVIKSLPFSILHRQNSRNKEPMKQKAKKK